MNTRREGRGLVLPAIAAATGFAILCALGTCQIERKQWKENLIAALTQRLAAPPATPPAKDQWAKLDPAHDEFRRVAVRAEFLHDQEALVHTVGSALRPDVTRPGYWVFTPARMADGTQVVVNRGFVPREQSDPKTRSAGRVAGPVEIVGVLRWPEARGWFAPSDEAARNVWYTRDHRAIAAAKGWGETAPFFIDQEAPAPPGGLPLVGPLAVRLRNDHLQYALTWYGLAAVLAVTFTLWANGRRSGTRR